MLYVVERGGRHGLFKAPQHPYTVGLLRCLPRGDVPRIETPLEPAKPAVSVKKSEHFLIARRDHRASRRRPPSITPPVLAIQMSPVSWLTRSSTSMSGLIYWSTELANDSSGGIISAGLHDPHLLQNNLGPARSIELHRERD